MLRLCSFASDPHHLRQYMLLHVLMTCEMWQDSPSVASDSDRIAQDTVKEPLQGLVTRNESLALQQ